VRKRNHEESAHHRHEIKARQLFPTRYRLDSSVQVLINALTGQVESTPRSPGHLSGSPTIRPLTLSDSGERIRFWDGGSVPPPYLPCVDLNGIIPP
jgi:hypothetical protein